MGAFVVAILWVNQAFTNSRTLHPASSSTDSTGVRRQVVLVYVGSEACSVCSSDDFKQDLENLLSSVRREVESSAYEFYPIGVSLSPDTRSGIRHLLEVGDWAEVSLGGGWVNRFVNEFAWERGRTPITPELHVFERRIEGKGSIAYPSRVSSIKSVRGAETVAVILAGEQWWRLLPDRLVVGRSATPN